MDLKSFKKQLKSMSSIELRELMNKANLSELEYWLIKYAFIDKRMVANTCMKLSISEPYYYIKLPLALTKLYYSSKLSRQ